jgi:hypothetical protein
MSEEELRFACLRLALEYGYSLEDGEAIGVARKIVLFIKNGQCKAVTKMEEKSK